MLTEQGTKGARISAIDFPFRMLFTVSSSDLSDTHMQAAEVTSARKRNALLANQSPQEHCLLAWCSSQEDAEEVGDMWSVPRELIIREVCVCAQSVVSDSLLLYGLQPARLLCPWDSPGKNPRVGCHAFLQGLFSPQGLNPSLLLHRWILHCWPTREAH